MGFMSWVSRVMQKLTFESMGLMSWVSRVSIALSLIAVAVNGIHVVSVESNAKINIGVNGINVVSVESFEKITVTCHFWFEHGSKTEEKPANVLLKTERKKAMQHQSSELLNPMLIFALLSTLTTTAVTATVFFTLVGVNVESHKLRCNMC